MTMTGMSESFKLIRVKFGEQLKFVGLMNFMLSFPVETQGRKPYIGNNINAKNNKKPGWFAFGHILTYLFHTWCDAGQHFSVCHLFT